MSYSVFLTDSFRSDLDEFLEYASGYDEDWMREQLQRLTRIIGLDIAGSPHTWAPFFDRRALPCLSVSAGSPHELLDRLLG